MWPSFQPRSAFTERRARLDALLPGPKLFVAGLPRPRNFVHNPYPFRAESHFLYFAGTSIEGAILVVDGADTALYVEPPHPDEALWTGPVPTLSALERALELPVFPVDELAPEEHWALLPPQDAETAFWLADRVERDVEAGGGDVVEGRDADLADAVIALRLRHDEAAQGELRDAARVTALAHAAGRAAVRPRVTEAAVRAAMEGAIVAAGMTSSYAPIVTVHGEVLHSRTHGNTLRDGDLLLADVGAETPAGFAGDVTRVWPVSGRFSATQRALYDVVLAANEAAILAVQPGARFLDVHRLAGRVLTRGLVDLGILRGDADDLLARGVTAVFFPHGIGHLLGLDVHDMEDLGDRAGYAPGRARLESPGDRYLRLDRDLEPGMCVTIEPGYYRIDELLSRARADATLKDAIVWNELERFRDVRGIRIEDDVLVTADTPEVTSRSVPKLVSEIEG